MYSELNPWARVKLPKFWKTRPALWFIQADAQFHTHHVTSDNSKYYAVIAALDLDILEDVSDVIERPPAAGKYTELREHLIERFTDSEAKQFKRLLTEMELGECTPSQLFRKMKTLAGEKINEAALRTLWLQRLPVNVQLVLSVIVITGRQGRRGDKPKLHRGGF